MVIQMAQPIVLLCNFTGDRRAKLNMLCMRHRIRIRHVEPADFKQTLGALCGFTAADNAPTEEQQPFTDELLLMANFTPALANSLLKGMRQAQLSVPLKAVLTPTNVNWTLYQLHQEISAEAAGMAQHHDAKDAAE